jgi:TatD DNase family protein
MIIDSHCHLNFDPIAISLSDYITRANNEGVKYMLTISTEDKKFNEIIKIVEKYECVYGTYGIHPHESKLYQNIKSENIIENINKSKKIIGIGETGLDFFYNHSEKKIQIESFLEHIDASQKSNLPLIVHSRAAELETYEILKKATKNKDFKILIHCFTGTKLFAKKLIDLGAFISASGVITFKKSAELADVFKGLPNDKILVETDSPYLAPVPLRGKPNEPSYIIHTVKFLANLKNMEFSELSNITTKNFFNLFGKLK